MARLIEGLVAVPDRLNATMTKVLLVCSPLVLAFAVMGLFLYDEVTRIVYLMALGSIGLGNLLWAVGSLLPDERSSLLLRGLTRPFFVLMVLSLPVAVVLVTV